MVIVVPHEEGLYCFGPQYSRDQVTLVLLTVTFRSGGAWMMTDPNRPPVPIEVQAEAIERFTAHVTCEQ